MVTRFFKLVLRNCAELRRKQELNYHPIDKGGRDKNRSPNT